MQRTEAVGAPGFLTVDATENDHHGEVAVLEAESFIVAARHGPPGATIHRVRCPRCDVPRPVAEDEPAVACANLDCNFNGPNPHYRGPPSEGPIVEPAPEIHHVRCPRCSVRRPLGPAELVGACPNPDCGFIGINTRHALIEDEDWVGLRPVSKQGVQLRCPLCRTPNIARYRDEFIECPSIACTYAARNPVYEPDGYAPRTGRLRCPRCNQKTPAPRAAPVLACIHECDFVGVNPRYDPPQEPVEPEPRLLDEEPLALDEAPEDQDAPDQEPLDSDADDDEPSSTDEMTYDEDFLDDPEGDEPADELEQDVAIVAQGPPDMPAPPAPEEDFSLAEEDAHPQLDDPSVFSHSISAEPPELTVTRQGALRGHPVDDGFGWMAPAPAMDAPDETKKAES